MEKKSLFTKKSFLVPALLIAAGGIASCIGLGIKGWDLMIIIGSTVVMEIILLFIYYLAKHISFEAEDDSSEEDSKLKQKEKGEPAMKKMVEFLKRKLSGLKTNRKRKTSKNSNNIDHKDTSTDLPMGEILYKALNREYGTGKTIQVITLFLEKNPRYIHKKTLRAYLAELQKTFEKELLAQANIIDMRSQKEEADHLEEEGKIVHDIVQAKRRAARNTVRAMLYEKDTSQIMDRVVRITGYQPGNNYLVDSLVNPKVLVIQLNPDMANAESDEINPEMLFQQGDEKIENFVESFFEHHLEEPDKIQPEEVLIQ